MIRRVLKKIFNNNTKIDKFLHKYNLSKEYFGVNRKSVTRGVLIGFFWAFIPMPSQIVAMIFTAFFIRFNVPIALNIIFLSNPLTFPPMYYMEYATGNFILGNEGLTNIEWTLEWIWDHSGDIIVPLYVGTAFYSFVVTPVIYLLVNWAWIYSVHSEKKRRQINRQNNKKREDYSSPSRNA